MRLVDRARSEVPDWQQIEAYWLEVGDATTLVLVRTFYGLMTLFWTATLLPDIRPIFFDDGIRPNQPFLDTRVLSLFKWVRHDALFVAVIALLLVTSLLVVLGKWVRVTVPITALLHISLIDASAHWGIGAERTMILGALYLGVFHMLTPNRLLGHFSDDLGSRGITPLWGLRLMQIQIVIAYLTASISKFAGADWRTGTAVFHVIEAPGLQRFTPPGWLTDNIWTIRTMTYSTLGIELVLAPLLLWPRTRKWGVLLAITLHVGFEVFLELGFFAMAMFVLILSFAPTEDVSRILDWRPFRTHRSSAQPVH